ncbi:MAG TPA: AgmX/PglI C-terminal domain-containing protein [Polyangiaceae bacterium]|nr:AgmX/PglI C-terminal domain-containing protein [Polyangiaceae bacterium]
MHRAVTLPGRLALLGVATLLGAGLAAAEDRPESRPLDAGTGEGASAVSSERPFFHGRRPRSEGAVQAAVEDEALARWNVGGSSDPDCASNRRGFHVAPRVKVDIDVREGRLPAKSAKQGELSELAVLAQTRNRGYWPLRLCYQEGLRAAPKLAGKTAVHMTIGRSGHVAHARLLTTELRDHEVATCVASRLGALSFAPAPRRRVEVDVTVDLNPGDAVLPDTCTAEDPESVPDAVPSALQDALEARLPALESCYAAGLERDPALWGRIAFELDVAPDGRVRKVGQHDSRFPDTGVVACGARALEGLGLPSPAEGGTRLVWGVRFGQAPSDRVAAERTNPPGTPAAKSLVAEPTRPRLRLAP